MLLVESHCVQKHMGVFVRVGQHDVVNLLIEVTGPLNLPVSIISERFLLMHSPLPPALISIGPRYGPPRHCP